MDADVVLREIIDAHGGAELWRGARAFAAEVSAWGLLFVAKRRPALRRVRVSADAHEPRFAFHDFPSPGETAEWIGDDEVRISRGDGVVAARRLHPRVAMGSLRRFVSWDALDFVYFGGYAFWNYLVAPFLFLQEGFEFELLGATREVPKGWVRLRVRFPGRIPTHCAEQIFFFDGNRRLRRLDYTAEVVGRWARAAHLCEGYRDFDGLLAPTRRRVVPRLRGGRVLPGPLLVGIEVHDLRVVLSP